jgi:hypothetical protein
MSDALIDLLNRATVRIDIGDELAGTGFFVAAGHVLTCTHVVEAARLASTTQWSDVNIVDSTGAVHTPTGQSRIDVESDLGWLRLASAPSEVPFVLLDETVEVDDELYAYGFPKGVPSGSPGTFVAEGLQGGPPLLIKFKSGQVRPGMSGAPLLNRRTGAVCGVLRRTRDEETDLGGYGIPTALLSQVPILEDLLSKNSQAAQSDKRWREALSPQQRILLGIHKPSTAAASRALVIDVGMREDRWWISAVEHPSGESVGNVPVDLNAVRSEVARLFRLWKAHGRLGEEEQSRLLGSVLAKAVLAGSVGERFEELVRDNVDLDLALHFQDGIDLDLIQLPWEQLYVPEQPGRRRGAALGAKSGMTLTRVLDRNPAGAPPPVRDALSVMVVTAPQQQGTYPGDRARDILQALNDITNATGIDGGSPSDDTLQDKLVERSPEVVHYIGYGRYENLRDQLVLDSDEPGQVSYLDPEAFAECVGDSPPRVIVLEPCEQPTGLVPADLTMFAPQLLLLRNVEAVIAFQQPGVDRDDARRFLEPFYRALAEGASIRAAVQQGRIKLRRRRPWAMPALFACHPGDMRLVASRRSAATGPRSTWGGTGV